ncbi:MAG: hypothetical protein K0Q72_2443 [Armatimonadetes bacterium]|nr:hypothetical protein [Armatimonadota bacterium]
MSCWSRVPSGWSRSPYLSFTSRPAGPLTESSACPERFWPMSKTKTPGFGSVTLTGLSVFVIRIGSICCAVIAPPGAGTASAVCHRESS